MSIKLTGGTDIKNAKFVPRNLYTLLNLLFENISPEFTRIIQHYFTVSEALVRWIQCNHEEYR